MPKRPKKSQGPHTWPTNTVKLFVNKHGRQGMSQLAGEPEIRKREWPKRAEDSLVMRGSVAECARFL